MCNLTDVKLNQTDLRKTTFENCSFNGVDFNQCDLRGMYLDGQTFIGVKFDKASLKRRFVSGRDTQERVFPFGFIGTPGLRNTYRAIKTICFDGAMMDKLTYAALKGL